MRFPVALYAQAVSQLFPLAAALTRRGRQVPVPARWVLVWCILLVVTDLASLAVAYSRGENLWLQYLAVPLGSVLVLWALSEWQLSDVMRLAYRLTIPTLVLASAAVLLMRGPAPLFDEVVGPIHALVLLAASLHTLLHRALRSERTILGESWFWIGLGLSLYFAASVAIGPFAQALLVSNVEWVREAYIARAWTSVLAFVLITTGILCPLFRRASGGPSSPRDSRSR
jgi:hypothetical protein